MYISFLILTGICELYYEFTLKREWYLPFQKFRYKLVKLVDELLEILDDQEEFKFSFDGQTIVLEDYLEIRPENKEALFRKIREGRVTVGPWYILPDIWLVGQESLIRNLEYSYDLAKAFNIPLMNIAYLPDMFGHSRAIPQLIGDLTNLKVLMVWRGIPPKITTVPFQWKSDASSKTTLLTIYLPFGYGNAASLPEDISKLTKEIENLVDKLNPFSPLPIYLLQYGTDHQIPNQKVISALKQVRIENMDVSLNLLDDFITKYKQTIIEKKYQIPEYIGELRSSARAPLLQDTYSARMWIKQWNQKVEDILVHYAEPLNTHTWFYLNKEYATSFLSEAWKWHLRNQPHDSICGCSVDQTHNEMKFRYSFAESIAENIVEDAITNLGSASEPSPNLSCLVYNPTNCNDLPMYFEFAAPIKSPIHMIKSNTGEEYEVQPLRTSSDIIWEMTTGSLKLKALMKMLPGRKLLGLFINDVSVVDSEKPETCEVRILMGEKPEGEFDISKMKEEFIFLCKKYKKFHILVTREIEQTYSSVVPLNPFSISKFTLYSDSITSQSYKEFLVSNNRVKNDFYEITFNKDGTFNHLDIKTAIHYLNLHKFEDWGDQGDEYTFGRLKPEFIKESTVKRSIESSGPLFCDIRQTMTLELFSEADITKEKRVGKVKIPVITNFRFYRDLPRIDIRTELINKAKDHRLRICFDLPYKSQFTKTSTHFGCIKRYGNPVGDDSYIERPSGIQPQKRYIRVEDDKGHAAITVLNKGLPEVELVNNSRVAITLLRAIGQLSRSGIPERPGHAGPPLATPEAQELNKKYIFEYGIVTHSKEEPTFWSADHSEAFSLIPKSIFFNKVETEKKLLNPIIKLSNPNIRISSIRIRNEKIWITFYNLLPKEIIVKVHLHKRIERIIKIKNDETEIDKFDIKANVIELNFNPHEIMICTFE